MSNLSDDQTQRILEIHETDGLIAAVKAHREMTDASLAESKSFVEALAGGESPDTSGSLSEDTIRVITEHLADGEKIQAIKAYRDATGCSLVGAKTFIEALMVRLREEDPQRFPEPKSGCAGAVLLLSSGPLLVGLFVALM